MEADDLLCSRTRGRGHPSPGIMARLGVPVGGRVRRLRALEDQSAPTPKRQRASLEGAFISPVTVIPCNG